MRCAGSKGVYPSHHLTGRRFVTNTYNWFSNKIEICRLRLSILAIFRRSPLLEVTDRLWRSMARMPNTFACPKAKKSIDISITSFKCVGLSGDCTAHQSNCGYATHGGEQKNESSHEGMEVHQRFGERWDEWRKKILQFKSHYGMRLRWLSSENSCASSSRQRWFAEHPKPKSLWMCSQQRVAKTSTHSSDNDKVIKI